MQSSTLTREQAVQAAKLALEMQGFGSPWKSPGAHLIETGYMKWLRTVAPKTYKAAFEDFHREYWVWWWKLLKLRADYDAAVAADNPKAGDIYENVQLDCVMAMGRGLAKSAMMEGGVLSAGAILGDIFAVYISSTQEKATEHLQSIRATIEGSELIKYYPGLANPRIGVFGNQRGWKAEAVYTDSGFAVVAASLEKGIRGLRDAEKRPTILIFDDIDERDDSLAVKHEKFETLRLDAMPMLAPFGTVLFGQNLIYAGSLMDDTFHDRLDWFYNAKKIGIVNTFKEDLVIEKHAGRPTIVEGTPNWTRINKQVAQDMLNKFGEEGFLRECQNLTSPNPHEMVWKHFDKDVHVITWTDFRKFFGADKIPERWNLYAGYDRGYTGWDGHPSVVSVCAVAAQNTPLSGDVFIFYEYVTTAEEGVDDIARQLCLDLPKLCQSRRIQEAGALMRRSMAPDLSARDVDTMRLDAGSRLAFDVFNGSHEGKSERDQFRRKYGIPVAPGDSSKTAGLAQLHSKLQCEAVAHPFFPGVWKKPNLYLVVDPVQKGIPVDRWGLRRHRQEAENLKWDRKVVSRDVAVKMGDDATDAVRQYFQTFKLTAAPFVKAEIIEERLAGVLRSDDQLRIMGEEQRRGYFQRLARERFEIEEAMREDDFNDIQHFIELGE